MAEAGDREFRIRVAKASDARLLHAFLFARPDNHIRALTIEDVIGMIRRRIVHIAEASSPTLGWDIAGACYIDGPQGPDLGEFELGGAYVSPEYRGFGIFRMLATSAIVNHLVKDRPIDNGEPLIAHVHEKNAWPRPTLEGLGFTLRDKDVAYQPDMIPGLGHMPRAEDGCIHADTYVFPPGQYLVAMSELMAFSGFVTGKDGQERPMAINIFGLNFDTLAEILPEVVAEIESLPEMAEQRQEAH